MIEQLKNFDWNSFSQALMTGEAYRYLLVSIIIIICSSLMYIFLAIGYYSDKPLRDVEQSIVVEDSRVIIDKLPSNYNYKKQDDSKTPESDKKQVFKYEEDATFNSSYLVMESGKKYKLNEEDTKFLKEKGVK